MVQLSHPYVATGKTIALTRQTFVSKLSLLFSMLRAWCWERLKAGGEGDGCNYLGPIGESKKILIPLGHVI